MILSSEELQSLTSLQCSQPHTLLGMHPLGKGKGVVVRALVPDAEAISINPVHEPKRPKIELRRIEGTDVFEGTTDKTDKVYAYDLVVTGADRATWTTRDAYSFLPTINEEETHRFGEGTERNIHRKLGGRLTELDGVEGVAFAVWAPNARRVSVVGDFNNWDGRRHMMRLLGASGIWEIFIPGVRKGAHYKFELLLPDGAVKLKTDPFGRMFETPPKNAAIVWETESFEWTDQEWLKSRKSCDPMRRPMSIYELHPGSWVRKGPAESLSYREMAPKLIEYLNETGFTHVEFMPVAEHAFYPSWGYQVTGFYAPTSRYGTPEDFQYLVNELHRAGFGVFVDWVPAHFPKDDWALARFDGTALYEHADPRQGEHQDWGTLIFNFGRHEVRNFLTSNALFWCDQYHIDGLRVDAVASMLYLDYSREGGQWVPNKYGGRENLEAVEFLKEFNHLVHTEHPGVVTIAEESTAWPQVTRPPYAGGLGFTFKWNMGWMHDTLGYFKRDSVYRKYHQNELTFAMLYHYNENFVLPLSHDEVVHGKGSLLARMPGDDWQRFANLRCLLAYQWLFPGKKLLFMGCEFGQSEEWNHNAQLNWALLEQGPYHAGTRRMLSDLNRLYKGDPAFWEADFSPAGFSWVDCSDQENSVLSFVRRDEHGGNVNLIVLNLTPVLRGGYRIGVPGDGRWGEVFNSDAETYGGGNQGNMGGVQADAVPSHGFEHSAEMTLPPLGVVVFKRQKAAD